MATQFDLIITVDAPSRTAEFRLLDAHGSQLAYRHTDFKTISVSHWQGLFDLRNYLRLYVAEGQEPAAVAEIGVCIAEEVLGQDIFEKLWTSESQRTLRIQLPGAAEEENHLAAALARVPWEIARPRADAQTLGERNLLVRVVHDRQAPISQPVELAPDEPLRVLFVFAEARGSRPLGARQERLDLLRLFSKEIYPQRRVVAHFLTHGVTRERLIDQIQQHNGYHVVHWSGHGHLNLLELARPGGAKDYLSGDQLLDLFTDAGGFLPRLVFLSACHSGDILRVQDWNDFLAVAQGQEPGAKEAARKDLDLQEQPGFTGTAHALLHRGVPSVVAMRYAVGDDYARELAVEYYRALLAHAQPKNAAAALNLARQALLDRNRHDPARFAVCDHATPVLYGAEQPGFTLAPGRSPELNPRNPRLHRIAELTPASHEHFVGRTWELAGLGSDFIGASSGVEVKPVAAITGLGGMGKTALVAEALELWETRFDWVLLYQAKPNPLGFDATLRDIDLKLRGELGRYYDHVKTRPADAIYRDASAEFTGPARQERLTRNLIRALQDEAILLVLDNFETNLKPQPEPSFGAGQPVWACQDPAWDECLKALASELVGSRSRVLITSRKPLAALAGGAAYPVLLGPLPATEAALYLQAHPALSRMVFGPDAGEKALALRLLNASRFHPLLMDRLARLAVDANLRPQLLQALDTLEKTKDFAQLPALFATTPGDTKELDYLNDALAVSLDQLICNASPDARRLLWLIAVANEPVVLELLNSVWSGESTDQLPLRLFKQMLERLPPEFQEKLKSMPPELRALLDADAAFLAALRTAFGQPDSLAALLPTLDQLIRCGASQDTRHLACLIAASNEMQALVLNSVWSGESTDQLPPGLFKQIFERLPPELQEELKAMPPGFRVLLDALSPEPLSHPELLLLRHLVSVGLATEEREGPDDTNPGLTCHELVRERIRAWMEQQTQDRGEWTENAIRLSYAERLEMVFKGLRHRNMTAALQAGSRALVYFVQAEAWDRLGGFASSLVVSTRDPRLLAELIPHLRTAAESAPEGKPRWRCLGILADALRNGGRPDASLPFYEQAAILARATAEAGGESSPQAWGDLAWITSNWARALRDVGHLDAAHQQQLEAAAASRKAGSPQVKVIVSELEALRIDIWQGQVETVLPEVEARLAQVAAWWQRHRSGQPVPEALNEDLACATISSVLNFATNTVELAGAYMSALDVAKDADSALENWTSALGRLDAILEVQRALEQPAEYIAATRTNRVKVLKNLRRFGEARAELEDCLPLFQNDPAWSARVLGSLASLLNEQDDVTQAIIQQRRALALHEQLPDPVGRASSHNNLAIYLDRQGTSADLAESARHRLAALIYQIVTGLGQDLHAVSLHNYDVCFHRAHAAGTELTVPRVAELLADPAFHPLDQWLLQRQVDVVELQAEVDQLLEQIRQAALNQL